MIRSFAVSQAGLKAALDSVKETCRDLRIDDEVANRLCVIVDETVANMIMHGGLTDSAEFRLALFQIEGGARLEITDPGMEFDPVHWPPDGHSGPGGRGIALTKGLAHQIDYTRVDDRNVLIVSVLSDD